MKARVTNEKILKSLCMNELEKKGIKLGDPPFFDLFNKAVGLTTIKDTKSFDTFANEDFFKDYRIKGEFYTDQIIYYVSYALSIVCFQKEFIRKDASVRDLGLFISKVNQKLIDCDKTLLALIVAGAKADGFASPFVNLPWEEILPTSSGFVDYASMNIICNSITGLYYFFNANFALWKAKKLDDNKILQLIESVFSDCDVALSKGNVKNKLVMTPFQYATIIMAFDFLEQIANKSECSGTIAKDILDKLSPDDVTSIFVLRESDILDESVLLKIMTTLKKTRTIPEFLLECQEYIKADLNDDENNPYISLIARNMICFQTYISTTSYFFEAEYAMASNSEKMKKETKERKEQFEKELKRIKEESTNKSAIIKKYKKESESLTKQLNKLSEKNKADLEDELKILKEKLSSEKQKNRELKNENELLNGKLDRTKKRLDNIERKLSEEAFRQEEMDEEPEFDTDENGCNDCFSEENLKIAENCKLIIFVPETAEVSELSRLLPKSTIITVDNKKNMEVDYTGYTKAVLCTKDVKNNTRTLIRTQCAYNDIEVVPIISSSTKSIFTAAVGTEKIGE